MQPRCSTKSPGAQALHEALYTATSAASWLMLDALFADAAHPLDPFAVNLLACQDRPFDQFIEEIKLDAEPIFRRVIEAVRHSELSIEEGLHRAICDGSLPELSNTTRMARMIQSTLNGLLRLRVMNVGATNLSDAEMRAIVRP